MNLGKISVGDKLHRIKAKNNNVILSFECSIWVYQMATPTIAMMYVDDSAA
jgi:hypothetical protein